MIKVNPFRGSYNVRREQRIWLNKNPAGSSSLGTCNPLGTVNVNFLDRKSANTFACTSSSPLLCNSMAVTKIYFFSKMDRAYGTPPRNLFVEIGRKRQLPSRGLLDLTNFYWGWKEKCSDHFSTFPVSKVSLNCPFCGRDE